MFRQAKHDRPEYYWTDESSSNRPHTMKHKVQKNGGSVVFWGCMSSEGPGYGSFISKGAIDSLAYQEVLQTSLLDTLKYYGKVSKQI